MDRTAKLWHIEYTHPLRVYAGHEQDVDVVKFHPNCNYVATGGSDKTIRLWSHSDAKMVSFEFGAFKLRFSTFSTKIFPMNHESPIIFSP